MCPPDIYIPNGVKAGSRSFREQCNTIPVYVYDYNSAFDHIPPTDAHVTANYNFF